ncbi:MAG TPA: histidine kinase [Caldimonas sp.]|nr:histidine kinase [Caldimonas sp.]
MLPLLIRRRASAIQIAGRWVLLAFGLSLLTTLFQIKLDRLIVIPLDLEEWGDVYRLWWPNFAGIAPTVLIVAVAQQVLPLARWIRWPLLVATVAGAVWAGWMVRRWWASLCGCEPTLPGQELGTQQWLLVIAALVAFLNEYRLGFARAAESLHQAEVERLRLQSELAEGRLQLLQAQIEPHFLFNSLANVRRLLRTDGSAGRAMLADLLRYLESALPRLREERPTLEREVEVVRAFLGVHQVRMGPRLKVDFDVPKALGDRIVPPMMLLTLVENALKHGLHPLLEGGSIRIAATSDPTTLRVQVADTGRGLGTSLGAGTGLANIRARLRSMYGAAAQLTLRVNEPRGVVAMIELPLAAS